MKFVLVILGVLLLVGAGAAWLYNVTDTNSGFFGMGASSTTQTPYAVYAPPLALAGIVLVIVGMAMKQD